MDKIEFAFAGAPEETTKEATTTEIVTYKLNYPKIIAFGVLSWISLKFVRKIFK